MMTRSEMMRERWSDPLFKEQMRKARWGEHVTLDFPLRHETQRCACGCGQFVPLYNQTKRARGIVKGQPAKFVHGHNARGERNNNWKGGRAINGDGYVQIRLAPGLYEYEHRLVMAAHLGRPLEPAEVVHHIDGDRTNNQLENLMLVPGGVAEHMRIHRALKGTL